MLPQIIADIICSGLCHVLFAGLAGGDSAMKNAQKPSTELRTSAPTSNRSKRLTESRDTLRNCSHDDCFALTFRSTDYCWRHQDETPSEPKSKPEEEEAEPVQTEDTTNWWEEQTEIE